MPRWTHQDGLLPGICFDTPYEHGGHFGPGSRKHKTRKKQDKKYKQANNLNGPNKGWGKSPKAKSDAYHKVNSYIRGDKTAYPSVHTIRTAWPELTATQRKRIASLYLTDRASSIHGEYDNPRKPPTFLRKYDSKKYDAILASTAQGAADRANQAATDEAFNNDLGRAVEFGALVAPVGPLAGALVKGARALRAAKGVEEAATVGRGAKVAEATAEATRATTSARRGSKIVGALKSTRAAKAARTAATGSKARVAESALGRAAAATARGASKVAATKGGRAALRTAAVGSKPITSPIKVGYPTYLGTSAAVAGVSGENIPDAVKNAASMNPSGTFKDIISTADEGLSHFGIAGNAVKDLLELPAAVVPSTYLLGEAAVKAIGGDDAQLKAMVNDYIDKGLLSGVAKGDVDQVITALKEHPVMSGLEAYGAGAGLSRAAGAATRGGIGSIERKPLELADGTKVAREYKKGLVGKAAGVLRDERRKARNRDRGNTGNGGQKASPKETERILAGGFWKTGLADRQVGKGNLVTRAGRSQEMKAVEQALPKGKANRTGVNLAINYGLHDARAFLTDLGKLKAKALAERDRLIARSKDRSIPKDERTQAKHELTTNEKFISEIDSVIKGGDVEAIIGSAETIAPRMKQLQQDLVDSGVGLDAAQAEKAALIPAARLHLDAGYGRPTRGGDVAAESQALGSPGKWIAENTSRNAPVPDVKSILGDLKQWKGKPGVAIESLRGLGGKSLPGGKVVVFRNAAGEPVGAMQIFFAPKFGKNGRVEGFNESEISNIEIAVEPAFRRQGIAAQMAKAAYDAGIPVHKAGANDIYTAEGAALRAGVLTREAGRRPRREAPQVLDKDGNPYSTEQIKADLKAAGVDPEQIGFVSQRPGAGGRGDFWQPWYPKGGYVASRARTGEASVKGWDAQVDSLVGQMVRSRGIVDNARTFRDALRTFAAKGPKGKVRVVKSKNVEAVKAQLHEKTGVEYTAIKLRPRTDGGRRTMEEVTDVTPDELGSLLTQSELWARAVQGGPGDYVLIPKAVADRFGKHFNMTGVFRQTMQMVNQAFKGTVLPYSPKWLLSNVADINMRAMLAGQPPLQAIFSRNAKFAEDIIGRGKLIDPARGGDAQALFKSGTHYGSQNQNRYFGRLENLAQTSRLGEAMLRFRHRPTVDGAVRLHQASRDWVFGINQRLIEDPGRLAILGKQLRQEAIQKGYIKKWESVWKLDDAARNDLAKGLLETENQVKYAKGIDRVFGQWDSNSPAMREFLVDYAPFGMWTRAATKFVFHTLPADHPVLVGIIAATEKMTEEERKKLGLSVFSDEPLPPNLRAGIPLGGGGVIGGVSGMSSFGFFADPGNAMAATLYPQLDDPLTTLKTGRDWTGKVLEHEDGTPLTQPELIFEAVKAGAETFFPPLAVMQRGQTLAGGDDVPDSIRDLLLGKNTEPDIVDYLRTREANGVFEGVRGSSTSSSGGYSSPYSSSGSSVPSFLNSYGSGSSSSTPSYLDGYGR